MSYAAYLAMLGVLIGIDVGMLVFLAPNIYPPVEHQFLNGEAPNAMALLTGNGSYEPMTEPVRVAGFVDLVGLTRWIRKPLIRIYRSYFNYQIK